MHKKKNLIICQSIHHGNTKIIAEAIADELDADLLTPSEINKDSIRRYGLIGFGSGIYSDLHHKSIFDLVETLPAQNGKKAFVFSTSGVPIRIFGEKFFNDYTKKCSLALKERLVSKGFEVLEDFSCPGYNTNVFLKYFGGINRKRPNEDDLKKAREFAARLKECI